MASPDIPIYVTLLPNGASSGKLKFSVALTPSLPQSASLPDLLADWPANSNDLHNNSKPWTLKFNGQTVAAKNLTPVSTPPDSPLWTAIFNPKLSVKARQGADKSRSAYANSWMVLPRIPALHNRHLQYRTAHLVSKLLATSDATEDTKSQWDDYLDSLSPRAIYIYPVIQKEVSEDNLSMADVLADRRTALAVLSKITDEKIVGRINHGQKQLEQEEGQQLSALAVLALYQHCVESFRRPLSDPDADKVFGALKPFLDLIDATRKSLVMPDNRDDDLFAEVRHYVDLHLFKDRLPGDCPPQAVPDFHQTLGLLQKYPFLMRPLGLVFDFADVELTGAIPAGNSPLVSIAPPKVSGASFLPMNSVCSNPQSFQMQSRNNVHVSRCLNLSDPSFHLITEDADGTAQKLTQQAAGAARQVEYQTTPPPSSNIDPPNPTDDPTSTRTAGIGLYHDNRNQSLADLLQHLPDPDNPDKSALYLEDVTLGYRADVQVVGDNSWASLHLRDSKYFIGSNPQPRIPAAERPTENAADEGFITQGATHSDVAESDKQLQIHESMVVWTGWSLSVPRPKDEMLNDSKSCPGPNPSLPIDAKYSVPKGTCPKLRFGKTYSMRLRHVDLAGNSIAATDATGAGTAITLEHPFSRHEPIRAPQILLETPIDRRNFAGEQSDRMVLRDMAGEITRMLAPPREPQRMAELYDVLPRELPPSAFSRYHLTEKGAFPTLQDACDEEWIDADDCDTVEANDAIVLRGASAPKVAFYPDPAAKWLRIEPFVLQSDLHSYIPWMDDGDAVPDKSSLSVYYANLEPFQPWPDVVLVRIVARSVKEDKPLRFILDMLSEGKIGTLPTIPTLIVELPRASTVAVRLSSASSLPEKPSEFLSGSVNFMVRRATPPNAPAGIRPPAPSVKLAPNFELNLFHSFHGLIHKTSAEPARNFLLENRNVAAPANNISRPNSTVTPALQDPVLQQSVGSALKDVTSATFSDGSIPAACPVRTLTLVHAVRHPLYAPDFAGDERGSGFTVVRAMDATSAAVATSFSAHWPSTAKIACHATWTDCIDDLTRPEPCARTVNEVAFEFVNQAGAEKKQKKERSSRDVKSVHAFRDTRARSVKYSLSAYTRFREYYISEDDVSLAGERACTVQVASSVRPPAPAIAYVLPAFSWRDAYDASSKTWKRGRTMVMRVYLERPFLVSGDQECVGVVLASKGGGTKTNVVSVTQWGADPILKNEFPIESQFMSADNFVSDDVQLDCRTFETGGGVVDVVPFPVEFSPDRRLWFCDIPLSATHTASAFARLALVRWQPNALNTSDDDARLSQIVLADFLQVGADRWVSVKKNNAKEFSVSVSGVFRHPHLGSDNVETENYTIACSLEQRWHRLGQDMGWRPVCAGPPFTYTDHPKNGNISQWEAKIDLPHSATFYKFRLLLEEREWFNADVSKANDGSTAKVLKPRTTYLHYIEL